MQCVDDDDDGAGDDDDGDDDDDDDDAAAADDDDDDDDDDKVNVERDELDAVEKSSALIIRVMTSPTNGPVT